MQAVRKVVILALTLIFISGCVSSKEYKARIADIDGLKGNISALDEKLDDSVAENDKLKTEISGILEELEELQKERDALKNKAADLEHLMDADRLELTKEVTDLKEAVTKKDISIKELQDELAAKDERIAGVIAEREGLQEALDNIREEKRKAELEKKQAVEELQGTYEELVSELKEEIQKGRVAITSLKDKLTLSMVDKVLFDSGSAEVKPEGREVLDRVAGILKKATGRQIRVEGHTDDKPIGPRLMKKFPTNWELSSRRAANVVRHLQDEAGIDPGVLSAAAYAEFRPVASNKTRKGRARNRRIEIVLVPLDVERAASRERLAETDVKITP